MTYQFNALVFTALIAIISAATPAAVAAADSNEMTTRSPGDLKVDERREMMAASNDYSNCIYKRSLEIINEHQDIRQVADRAMGDCVTVLDELEATITGWGFDQYFADGFSRNVRDRAARKLIPELAIRKSR